eukprot:6656933-Pyramimonas_sp.AAC.1
MFAYLGCCAAAPRPACDTISQEDPPASLLRIQRELAEHNFVCIPGKVYRALLKWNGAEEKELQALEAGDVHAEVASDPEPNMYFRQVAFHRMVLNLDGDAPFEAMMPAVTQINPEEITSDSGAKVAFARSKTRHWPEPPKAYAGSSVAMAIAALNEAIVPKQHHPQSNINNDSRHVINDQILIRIKKTSALG